MSYESRESIQFWKNSLVRRFFLLSLLVASIPLLVTVLVYDRMTANLVSDMTAARAQQNLSQIKTSMYHFGRQHIHALEAIAELPQIAQLFAVATTRTAPQQTLSLIHFDIDRPEIYGALFFDADWQLMNALPGQSASGYPYWGSGELDIKSLPQTEFSQSILLGPQHASPGRSSWYLMAKPVYASGTDHQLIGYLAFQLRFASLTEYLSVGDATLLCQGSGTNTTCYDSLGRITSMHTDQIRIDQSGVEPLFDNWHLVNNSVDTPLLDREHERLLVLLMACLVLCVVTLYFYFLVKRVRRRVVPLIDAANAISIGEWNGRIPVAGNDEISLLARAFNRMTSHLDSLMLARGDAERKAVWGEFATGIAHEIRNPLATIKVCVQTLQQESAEDKELQTLMVGEIERINRLISDLLEYARPPDPETKHIAIARVMQRLGSLITPMAKERGIKLNIACNSLSESLCITADENQLQQILMNLLINALDASKAGSEVGLKVVSEQQNIVFVVHDCGCGMTRQQLDKISQPFYTTKTTGTGLGLSVSQRLAEMNKATLEFDSHPGEGTQAMLRFKREFVCEPESE